MQEKLTGKERTALLYLAALDDEIHKASPFCGNGCGKRRPPAGGIGGWCRRQPPGR